MESTTSIKGSGESQKQRPVQRFSAGDVQVAVWANPAWDGGIVHRATISKRFKRRDGTWSSASSFGKSDLGQLIGALQQAAELMFD